MRDLYILHVWGASFLINHQLKQSMNENRSSDYFLKWYGWYIFVQLQQLINNVEEHSFGVRKYSFRALWLFNLKISLCMLYRIILIHYNLFWSPVCLFFRIDATLAKGCCVTRNDVFCCLQDILLFLSFVRYVDDLLVSPC